MSDLADGLKRRLSKLGRDSAEAKVEGAATTFIQDTVPLWRRLGVIA
jgi:hypothetical protein